MNKITGDLWKTPAQVKVVPTNGIYTRRDTHVYRAVMGAGVAKQAADLYPPIAFLLGGRLHESGNRLYVFTVPPVWRDKLLCTVLVTFPTKHHWRDPALLSLICRSADELADAQRQNGWESILLPPVGCGLGGLSWGTVEELLEHYLDDHFTVIDHMKD